jgi:phosphocarrier protein|nr:HPr family phosphocarrier protein [Deltaproteobacteria bacterium]
MEFEDTVTIRNRLGLHARPACRFAQKASEFDATVLLVKDGKKVDGKNILDVLTLACPHGSVLTVKAIGPDADQAVADLKTLVENRFGELD